LKRQGLQRFIEREELTDVSGPLIKQGKADFSVLPLSFILSSQGKLTALDARREGSPNE
jgi:hypothetical protein